MAAISAPDAYMRFVSAVIHAVRVMRSEEGHQSVNLKENRQISPSPSRQTKERRAAAVEVVVGGEGDYSKQQSQISSSQRWRGWFRGGGGGGGGGD